MLDSASDNRTTVKVDGLKPQVLDKTSRRQAIKSLARVGERIVERIGMEPLLYVADDEIRAAKLAAIVAQLEPKACVLHVPASDALPGDDAPASPANAGQRVAALRRLREWREGNGYSSVVCITSAEATAKLYAPPAAFVARAPILACGDVIDLATLEAECMAMGYVIDDRIDEPR